MNISPLNIIAARDIGAVPSSAAIENYQLKKIQETIKYVRANSRFYNKKLQKFSEISSFSDLEKLPFTYPSDLSAEPNSFLCLPPDKIARAVTLATSGTTGKPKRVFFTAEELERAVNFFALGMTAIATPEGLTAILLPGQTPASVADLLSVALARSGRKSLILGPVIDCAEILQKINDFRADCVVGLPSQIFALARTGVAKNVKRVLLISDFSANSLMKSIDNLWNCKVFTHYGLTESGYGGAVMCEARSGNHIRETDLFIEIIDPKSGKTQKNGEWGEVVFTTLNRVAQPFIRYRTGDISRILPGICNCGSELRRLDRILGRSKSGFTFENGEKITITELDEILYEISEIRAFEASANNRKLSIIIDGGNPEIALEKLKQMPQLQNINIKISEGNVRFNGVAKREIRREL
ncbi:MAG: AMP-binding protein [Oscillospiraceae bacterium]|jgi:phenylacetate-coenzyme A ligase PaaK-like adenylate-forming protein|nr:AMP-binding protein [Oscillospiraceae bacterium]